MLNQLRIEVDIGQPGMGALEISWNAYGMLSRIEWTGESAACASPSGFPPRRGRGRPSRHSGTCVTESLRAPPPILDLIGRLRHYFSCGQPLGPYPWEWIDQSGWTPFQHRVYAGIAKIPHGETRTYGWVARRIGKGGAARAVGQALKRNPLLIFIPCHRVVAADSLGGFMGASASELPEISLKQRLILMEQSYLNPCFSFISAMTATAILQAVPESWHAGARRAADLPADEARPVPIARVE